MKEFNYSFGSKSLRSVQIEKLRTLAIKYGYVDVDTLRQFERHAQRKQAPYVLGVEYDEECGYRFYSDTSEPIGPIPAKPTQFLLPQGTRNVYVEVCDGPVSSKWRLVAVEYKLVHPYIVLQADTSGPIILLECQPQVACNQEY
jgi:hypothetical protein